MIETTRTVTTLDGKKIELKKGGPQILELQLVASWVSNETGHKIQLPEPIATAHITRDVLERCGKLPIAHDSAVKAVCTPPEELLRTLLESIGVVFE